MVNIEDFAKWNSDSNRDVVSEGREKQDVGGECSIVLSISR